MNNEIILLECGCCGAYHPAIPIPDPLQRMIHRAIGSDCRNDANRFSGAEDYADRLNIPDYLRPLIVEISLEEQEEDEQEEV